MSAENSTEIGARTPPPKEPNSVSGHTTKEEIPELIKELNETGILAICNDDPQSALECFKRAEQLLEILTSDGGDVERNTVLMILYNLACINQMAGSFEECTKYIDASIFNMSQKSTDITPEDGLSLNKLAASAKMLKTRFLCKFHLQMCAVLSQLNRHREGLYHGYNAILYSHELINYTA